MKWKILSKKLILDNFIKFWNVELQYEKFSGAWSNKCSWYFIEKNLAAALILYDPSTTNILLVRQFRVTAEFYPEDNSQKWPYEIIAGSCMNDEAPLSAVLREAQEEAGIALDKPIEVCRFYPSPGIFGEQVVLFFKEQNLSEINLDARGLDHENEDVKPELVKLNLALDWIDQGRITDSKTILALLWLNRHLQKKQQK